MAFILGDLRIRRHIGSKPKVRCPHRPSIKQPNRASWKGFYYDDSIHSRGRQSYGWRKCRLSDRLHSYVQPPLGLPRWEITLYWHLRPKAMCMYSIALRWVWLARSWLPTHTVGALSSMWTCSSFTQFRTCPCPKQSYFRTGCVPRAVKIVLVVHNGRTSQRNKVTNGLNRSQFLSPNANSSNTTTLQDNRQRRYPRYISLCHWSCRIGNGIEDVRDQDHSVGVGGRYLRW